MRRFKNEIFLQVTSLNDVTQKGQSPSHKFEFSRQGKCLDLKREIKLLQKRTPLFCLMMMLEKTCISGPFTNVLKLSADVKLGKISFTLRCNNKIRV